MSRLPVKKTYKLYIGGAFPRSESGRTYQAEGQNVARASRKDLRDAVRARPRGAARLGGQDRLQPRPGRLPDRRDAGGAPRRARRALHAAEAEVDRSIDRLVWYAGWADKLAQVLGGTNPVAGPYFNFTIPEPTGVVGILAPDEPPLEGLVSRVAPAIVGGNATVVVASETHPLAAVELGEVLATVRRPGRRRQHPHRPPRRARAVARRRTWTSTRSTSPARTASRRAREARGRERQARRPRRRRPRRARGRSQPSSS